MLGVAPPNAENFSSRVVVMTTTYPQLNSMGHDTNEEAHLFHYVDGVLLAPRTSGYFVINMGFPFVSDRGWLCLIVA